MTRIIFVRHGQSVSNLEKRVIGQTDVPLTALGHRQAQALSDWLAAREHIDAIYASDLCRAVNTVAPLATRLGLPIIRARELREKDPGHWVGHTMEEIKRRYPEEYADWQRDGKNFRPLHGESYEDVTERMHRFITGIIEKHNDQTVLIASHAGAMRAFACGVYRQNGTDKEPREIKIENASLHYYEAKNGSLRLLHANLTEHLTQGTLSEITFE